MSGRPSEDHVHSWFGLSYANYLVLPRTLLQSMPDAWQAQFVALLEELGEAFGHIEQAQAYEVIPGEEHIVGEMTDAQLAAAGITAEDGPCGINHGHGDGSSCWPERTYHSIKDGREVDRHERALVPGHDPVPAYNRGRTYIEPRARQEAGHEA